MGCQTCLIIFVFLLLIATVALLTSAAVGTAWTDMGAVETGLWQICTTINDLTSCTKRAYLFEFKDELPFEMEYDIILILTIAGAGISLFALISILASVCQTRPSSCSLAMAGIFAFLGGGAGLAAALYFEFTVIEDIPGFDLENRGWANFTCYIGGCMGIIASAFAFIAICCRTEDESEKVNAVAMQPYQYNPSAHEQAPNAYQGYPNVGYVGPEIRY